MWQSVLVFLAIVAAVAFILRRCVLVWRSALRNDGRVAACNGCPGRRSKPGEQPVLQVKPLVQLGIGGSRSQNQTQPKAVDSEPQQ